MSDIPGTTTDPVRKAMEIPGIGPCVFTDTAGFDDDAAGLGEKRTGLTLKALEKTDIALMIFSDCGPVEKEWYRGIVGKGVPTVPVISKADLEPSATGSAAGRTLRRKSRTCQLIDGRRHRRDFQGLAPQASRGFRASGHYR